MALSIQDYGVSEGIGTELFGAYGEFLTILDDQNSREALDKLRSEQSRTDPLFQRVRKISESFERALDHIFFENKHIAPLTRKYGVF